MEGKKIWKDPSSSKISDQDAKISTNMVNPELEKVLRIDVGINQNNYLMK